ncbi:hypothetical protein PIB30_064149 [Stylosanthes scabra]|uniref:Uncharacterized protein n=1 Tax=Stylosanthes scabra TaxID=79078 RepID=A0ABU6TLF9_9FABA|nr:hypothetical protein [Stylosanthes scabra]
MQAAQPAAYIAFNMNHCRNQCTRLNSTPVPLPEHEGPTSSSVVASYRGTPGLHKCRTHAACHKRIVVKHCEAERGRELRRKRDFHPFESCHARDAFSEAFEEENRSTGEEEAQNDDIFDRVEAIG